MISYIEETPNNEETPISSYYHTFRYGGYRFTFNGVLIQEVIQLLSWLPHDQVSVPIPELTDLERTNVEDSIIKLDYFPYFINQVLTWKCSPRVEYKKGLSLRQ
ncbi:hypothetical protein C1645_821019 [Glomus cerebriforme]|uniref:Uncharacterized protein n=1 Tax=Glomus cerebriforme TaxID=658196 RepID=A0A397T321_9GLOM|nr:hypothetical protein C1645_821019 [Glomus cerebriforme]